MSFHAGVDALRANAIDDDSNSETPRLQRLYKEFARAADVGCGGQHDRLANCRVVNNAGACSRQCGQVGSLVCIYRCWHTDDDRLRAGHGGGFSRQFDKFALQVARQTLAVPVGGATRRDLISAKRLSLISNPMISAPWSARDKAVGSPT